MASSSACSVNPRAARANGDTYLLSGLLPEVRVVATNLRRRILEGDSRRKHRAQAEPPPPQRDLVHRVAQARAVAAGPRRNTLALGAIPSPRYSFFAQTSAGAYISKGVHPSVQGFLPSRRARQR